MKDYCIAADKLITLKFAELCNFVLLSSICHPASLIQLEYSAYEMHIPAESAHHFIKKLFQEIHKSGNLHFADSVIYRYANS